MNEIHAQGVMYLAFGRPYLTMAIYSMTSLRAKNPDLPICLITNQAVSKSDLPWLRERDVINVLDRPQSDNRTVKTSIYEHSPFAKTLFIDCDTVVLGDLGTGFKFLDHFDLALRLNPYPQTRKGKADVTILPDLRVGDCPHWNSGVLFFRRSERTRGFFQRWAENFNTLGNRYDQVSLAKTIFEYDARVLSLDAQWNATDPIWNRANWRKRTKIFHYATNISDKLLHELERTDRQLPHRDATQDPDVTRRFLLKKRASRRIDQGALRYALARTAWWLGSPV